jgi:polyisoprenoid-binding protein YceI
MFRNLFVLALVSAGLIQGQAQAASNVWNIDQEHSSVGFRVKHLGVSNVSGQFKKFVGTVSYDGRNIRSAVIDAKIKTRSVETRSEKRDDRLMGKSFFDAEEYPAITFKSQKIVPADLGGFKINGVISIHGFAREITLDAQPLREIQTPDTGMRRLITTATTQLDRKDFGISMGPLDRGGVIISDKVQVTLNIELVHSDVTPTPDLPRSAGRALRLQVTKVASGTTSDIKAMD